MNWHLRKSMVLCLLKRCKWWYNPIIDAIHQSGKWYTNENIDQMLMERHFNKKVRRSSHKNHMKGPRKRTEEDDVRFAQSFEKLILMAKSKEGAQSGTI